MVGRAFQVLTLPERLVQVTGRGTRLGADADGSWAYREIGERLFGRSGRVCSGDRVASVREVMEAPPNIATDAQPGYSVVAYQSGYSVRVKATVRFWSESKIRACQPMRGRRAKQSDGPELGIGRVAPTQRTPLFRRVTTMEDCSRGGNMDGILYLRETT